MLHAELSSSLAADVLPLIRDTGFARIRSVPSEVTADAIACRSTALYEFSVGLGTPMMQSLRNELVEDVKDYSDIETTDDRGYRSGGELLPHSDPPTLIILHCLHQAKAGGESSLVSVDAIIQRMMTIDPTLVDELFLPFPDWRVAGQYGVAESGPGEPRPVLAERDGVVSCVLYRPFIERAAEALGRSLNERQIAALDLFEECSMASELTIRFTLKPGDTLVLHNRRVLHARTDYGDWPEMHRRRHLLRVWIDAPDALPVHPLHELGQFFAIRRELPISAGSRRAGL